MLLDVYRSRYPGVKSIELDSTRESIPNTSLWTVTLEQAGGSVDDAVLAIGNEPVELTFNDELLEITIDTYSAGDGKDEVAEARPIVGDAPPHATSLASDTKTNLTRLLQKRSAASLQQNQNQSSPHQEVGKKSTAQSSEPFSTCPFDSTHCLPASMMLAHIEKVHMDDSLSTVRESLHPNPIIHAAAASKITTTTTASGRQRKRERSETSSTSTNSLAVVERRADADEKAHDSRRAIFVGFPATGCPSSDALRRAFLPYGSVTGIKIANNRRCGFVEFETNAMAKAALAGKVARVAQIAVTTNWATFDALATNEIGKSASKAAISQLPPPPPPPPPLPPSPPAAASHSTTGTIASYQAYPGIHVGFSNGAVPSSSSSTGPGPTASTSSIAMTPLPPQGTRKAGNNPPSRVVIIEVEPAHCVPALFNESTVFSALAPYGKIIDIIVCGSVAQGLFASQLDAERAVAVLSTYQGQSISFGLSIA